MDDKVFTGNTITIELPRDWHAAYRASSDTDSDSTVQSFGGDGSR